MATWEEEIAKIHADGERYARIGYLRGSIEFAVPYAAKRALEIEARRCKLAKKGAPAWEFAVLAREAEALGRLNAETEAAQAELAALDASHA